MEWTPPGDPRAMEGVKETCQKKETAKTLLIYFGTVSKKIISFLGEKQKQDDNVTF